MKSLGDLFTEYGSDKQTNHGFGPYYEEHLPEKVENFLEIGVWKGGGLRAFKDWYGGEGNFYGLNYVFGGPDIPSKKWFEGLGFNCIEGYQADLGVLFSIEKQFDVIIDDGSHHSYDQVVTFHHLFERNLKSGGLYIVEDVHCCRQPYWWSNDVSPIVKSFEDTFLGIVLEVQAGGDWESQFLSQWDDAYLKDNVSSIALAGLQEEAIAFIGKK